MRLTGFVVAAALVAVFSVVAVGQELTLADGLQAHSGVDAIYADFSKSYRTLDYQLVAGLYTEDASYLTPNSPIVSGRDKILDNFKGFFERTKERNRTMTISFNIVSRKVGSDLGYDVGTFRIKYSQEGKLLGESTGKFVVVTEKGADGKWRFAVDGYSGLEPRKD